MVKKLCLLTAAAAVLLALLLAAGGGWLLYSSAGTRWLLGQLSAGSAGQLSIGRSEGSLLGSLRISEVKLRRPGLRLQLASLEMNSRLRGLFPPRLEIDRLHASGMRLNRSAGTQPAAPQGFRWPQLPAGLGLLRIDLQDLELRQFSWQQDDREPQLIELLRGELHWREGTLEARQLQLQTVDQQASGSFSCGLRRPMLKVAVDLNGRIPSASWQQLQLRADLQPGTPGQLLHGPLAIDLTTAQGERLTATGELGLTTEQLQFRQLQLRRPQRPGRITASGSLRFSGQAPEVNAKLQLEQLDLQPETGQPLHLSGSLQVQGELQAYHGRFVLHNQGSKPTRARLSGVFRGDRQQLTLSDLQGEWLSGRLGGQLRLGWEQGWQLQGQLTGQDLDPQLLVPQLSGQLNPRLQITYRQSGAGQRTGQLQLQLADSTLQGQPLTGSARLRLQDQHLGVEQLSLHGNGLQLQASGDPAERLAIELRIAHLGQVVSEAAGRLSAAGWLRWRQQRLTGEFHAQGTRLGFRRWQLERLRAQGGSASSAGSWQLRLVGERLHLLQSELVIERCAVRLNGSLPDQRWLLSLARQGEQASARIRGGWDGAQWQGKLLDFQADSERFGHWQLAHPVALLLFPAQLKLAPLQLRGRGDSEVELSGSYLPADRQGGAELHWQSLDLALLRPWLGGWQLSGPSTGQLSLRRTQQSVLQGRISFRGKMQGPQLQLALADSALRVNWDRQGLQSSLQLRLTDGGELHAQLTAPQAAAFAWPQQGELQLAGRGLPLALLNPWLPETLSISGSFAGQTSGLWRPDELPQFTGAVHATAGRFTWQEENGTLGADISAADLSWQWQRQLQGKLELELREQGNIESGFTLPLPASWPLRPDPGAAVNGELHARLQELGLLSVLFPGRIQESRGQLKLDLLLAGTVQRPDLQGDFHLFDASAFLPGLGVQLEKIDLQGHLAGNQVRIAELQLVSGGGSLSGNGQLQLRNWLPDEYRLQLKGKNFQLINLPELQVRSSPELQITGTREQVKVRGQVEFPEVLISGKQKTALAGNSPDLVVVDRKSPAPRRFKLRHDIDLQLILGDRVVLNNAGIDARLGGKLRLKSTENQELAASGEIHVVKGKYSSYGVSLDITRGGLYFTGGPLDQPTLDILALRKVAEVKAGVKVTGTPLEPVVQLYSEPAMADTDILSYIVLGHPLGADRSQSGLLMTAAGALLSQGESVSLQEKLKNRLGLDVLDISSGSGDVNSAIITTGKYLSPDLYVSLGYSLFSNTNELTIRYNLTPSWEVESNIGIESGVDMYYRIEIE